MVTASVSTRTRYRVTPRTAFAMKKSGLAPGALGRGRFAGSRGGGGLIPPGGVNDSPLRTVPEVSLTWPYVPEGYCDDPSPGGPWNGPPSLRLRRTGNSAATSCWSTRFNSEERNDSYVTMFDTARPANTSTMTATSSFSRSGTRSLRWEAEDVPDSPDRVDQTGLARVHFLPQVADVRLD